MKSDQRYMKPGRSHGSTWFFVLNIPPDLRGNPRFMTSGGKPMTKVTESLGTKDQDKAREVRDHRLAYWNRQFRMLRHGPSEEDIQEEAVEIYRAALQAKAPPPSGAGGAVYQRLRDAWIAYTQQLDDAIEKHAHKEIADYCNRALIFLQPGTEPYRKIGLAFLEVKVVAGVPGVVLPLADGRVIRGDEAHLPPLPKLEPPVPLEPKPLPPPPLRVKGEAETFSEAFERYLKSGSGHAFARKRLW